MNLEMSFEGFLKAKGEHNLEISFEGNLKAKDQHNLKISAEGRIKAKCEHSLKILYKDHTEGEKLILIIIFHRDNNIKYKKIDSKCKEK